jgi:nucleoside-diphosphate-sugar epimerase
MKKALVLGAGGFIGSHLVKRLKSEGFWVKGIDLKYPEFDKTKADEFIIGDLRDYNFCKEVINLDYDELYQLAADMGGAGFTFTGDNDADIMHNSATINLNIADIATKMKVKKLFYSSSACIYPLHNQEDAQNMTLKEDSAYPAFPDSEYGWEKLFSERLYQSYHRNYNLNIRIARFHNIYGELGVYDGGREKAPAALCRKVIMATQNDEIEIWGNGEQLRSFLYIDECLNGIRKLMNSNFKEPINIGSDETVSINDLAQMIIEFSGKKITLKHIKGPIGVNARTSDNDLIKKELNWAPDYPLKKGMEITYNWIKESIL